MSIRIGTRGSQLARAQSEQVGRALAEASGGELDIEYVEVVTRGDTIRGSLVGLSETGAFVTALRTALLADECDVLVHSLKDMPVAPFPGLTVAAIPARADARDALCLPSGYDGEHDLEASRDAANAVDLLAPGAVVGTSSPRRAAQLRALRPDVEPREIRGNVDSRLAALGDGFDAVILAVAGLERLGRPEAVSHVWETDDMVPAPGQGALAIELRDDAAPALRSLVAALDHGPTRAAVTAERTALEVLQAGCAAPVGAHAVCEGGQVRLQVRVIREDGVLALNEQVSGPAAFAQSLGRRAAHALLGRGAGTLMGRS